MGLKWNDHGDNYVKVAGALEPGVTRGRKYDDRTCWADIYIPLFCTNAVPEEKSEGKYCMTCFKEFGLKRYLWKYCCKSINRYEHDYCLAEQCSGENGTPQDTNDFGTAWLHDDESLNKYGEEEKLMRAKMPPWKN